MWSGEGGAVVRRRKGNTICNAQRNVHGLIHVLVARRTPDVSRHGSVRTGLEVHHHQKPDMLAAVQDLKCSCRKINKHGLNFFWAPFPQITLAKATTNTGIYSGMLSRRPSVSLVMSRGQTSWIITTIPIHNVSKNICTVDGATRPDGQDVCAISIPMFYITWILHRTLNVFVFFVM